MSTTATADVAQPAQKLSKVPFARLVRVELRKTYNTRAGFWLLVSIALITLLAVGLFVFFAPEEEVTYNNLVGVTATPQGFLLPVLGILAFTSEWSQRTGLVTFTLEPSRARLLSAKFVAVSLLGILFIALALAIAALANVLGTSMGGDGSWTFGIEGVRDVAILQMMGLWGGAAFGMILLNSAAAIVLSFVLPTAFGIFFGIVTALEDWAPWIDLGTAQTPLFDHTMQGDDWAKLFVTSLWWIWLPLLAGIYRVMRSEVK